MANTFFIPEVYGDALREEIRGKLYFANFAQINTNLVGEPGNVVNLPYFAYAGDAEIVEEGVDAVPKNLTSTAVSATVKKAVAPYELTDEQLTQAAGGVEDQVRYQAATAIARTLDKELMTAALTSTNVVGDGTADLSYDLIVDARAELGDGAEGAVLVINSADEAKLLKDGTMQDASKFGAPIMVNGLQASGKIAGLPVYVSDIVPATKALVLKPNALVLAMKRDIKTEEGRNIFKGTLGVVSNVHFGAAIALEENVVVIDVL
jgi:N4-gp56 family major capsid protein